MSDSIILVDKTEGIATITLNRPDSMNALSTELIAAFNDTFADLKDDPSIGAAILTGNGRAFCAGLDLKELSQGGNLLGKSDEKAKVDANIINPMKAFGRPIIGAINGAAITGGFELALACDIIVASTEARFADTHARVGVIPGSELSQKLSRTIGIYRAKEVSLTGNFISAQQAESWGLVNRVVDPSELLPTCRQLAQDILSCPWEMVREYKQLIDNGFQLAFKDGVELERETPHKHFATVNSESIAKATGSVLDRGRKQQY